jgi:hypothetical protein
MVSGREGRRAADIGKRSALRANIWHLTSTSRSAKTERKYRKYLANVSAGISANTANRISSENISSAKKYQYRKEPKRGHRRRLDLKGGRSGRQRETAKCQLDKPSKK